MAYRLTFLLRAVIDPMKPLTLLGIETSCDETAVALVHSERKIIAQEILSQTEHAFYGGTVPEIAARSHLEYLPGLIKKVMQDGKCSFNELSGIAVTAGPGLIGGVMVGLVMAKALASSASLPFYAIHHLEGHALVARMEEDIPFPFLLLLVSGGHSVFLAVEGVGKYRKLGGTIDDAIGESFDKVAKMCGLSYPGGPIIEQYAKLGNSQAFDLPHPLRGREGCDLSLSGLKTAVRSIVLKQEEISEKFRQDISASFQYRIGTLLIEKTKEAMKQFTHFYSDTEKRFVIAGGVASNSYLRGQLQELCKKKSFSYFAPPPLLCTDNGAMIAWAGIEYARLGRTSSLSIKPKARWPIENLNS